MKNSYAQVEGSRNFLQLRAKYTKQQILEMYMNHIYFGHGAYGIQAAKLYFNKNVEDLTVEEGAMLAGLPKAPNGYSPYLFSEKSKERRDLVLSLMHKQGYLTAEESVRYQGKTIALYKNLDENELAYMPYIDMVIDEALVYTVVSSRSASRRIYVCRTDG